MSEVKCLVRVHKKTGEKKNCKDVFVVRQDHKSPAITKGEGDSIVLQSVFVK